MALSFACANRGLVVSIDATTGSQQFLQMISRHPRVLKKGLKSAQKALCCQGRVRRKQQEKDKVENVGFLIVTALFELT